MFTSQNKICKIHKNLNEKKNYSIENMQKQELKESYEGINKINEDKEQKLSIWYNNYDLEPESNNALNILLIDKEKNDLILSQDERLPIFEGSENFARMNFFDDNINEESIFFPSNKFFDNINSLCYEERLEKLETSYPDIFGKLKTPKEKLTNVSNLFQEKQIKKINTENFILKLLKDGELNYNDVKLLTNEQKLLLITFVIKKNCFPYSVFTNSNQIFNNIPKYFELIDNSITCYKTNRNSLHGLTETLLNRCIRILFIKWKKDKINCEECSSFDANKLFWVSIFENYFFNNNICLEERINHSFNINNILEKIQMKKKLKNKLFDKIQFSNIKYLNIFVNKEIKDIIFKLFKKNLDFLKIIINEEQNIRNQYSNNENLTGKERLFSADIKESIRMFIKDMETYIKKPKGIKRIRVKQFRSQFKNCFISHFLFEYEMVFKEIKSEIK